MAEDLVIRCAWAGGSVGFLSDCGGKKQNDNPKYNSNSWLFREFPFNPTYVRSDQAMLATRSRDLEIAPTGVWR